MKALRRANSFSFVVFGAAWNVCERCLEKSWHSNGTVFIIEIGNFDVTRFEPLHNLNVEVQLLEDDLVDFV